MVCGSAETGRQVPPGACLENVEYLPDRGLKQEELLRFGTCNYIQ